MRPALQRDPLSVFAFEQLAQTRFRGRNFSFFSHFSVLVQNAVMAMPITQVQAHGNGWLIFPLGFPAVDFLAMLLHWLVSFCTASACGQDKYPRSTRPAVSSHLNNYARPKKRDGLVTR